MAREIRVKLEYVIETELNVSQVRERLRLLESSTWANGPSAVETAIRALTDAKQIPQLQTHTASYNTVGGRKDGSSK
jgi:hypothetical protein